jgi:hypothetical protein
MSGMFMLRKAEAEQILQTAIKDKICAIMSYLSADKWHAAKIRFTDLIADRLSVVRFDPSDKSYPERIQINQPVGISFKHSYGKFVFDTVVTAFQPSPEQSCIECGETMVLAAPDCIEVVQRRSYFRVNVPKFLNVNVTLWRHNRNEDISFIGDSDPGPVRCQNLKDSDKTKDELRGYYQGKLIDISAGGAQIMVTQLNQGRLDLKKGQYIGLRFTPMPYEMPLMFNAQIRNILPAEDHNSVYICLQIVGLEASPEGRGVLSRIADVTKRYYQLNMSNANHLDMQTDICSYDRCSQAHQIFT